MSTNLNVGDVVEISGDYRKWLNGRRGVIVEIDRDRAIVKFDHVGRSREATVFLKNLVKVGSDEQ